MYCFYKVHDPIVIQNEQAVDVLNTIYARNKQVYRTTSVKVDCTFRSLHRLKMLSSAGSGSF